MIYSNYSYVKDSPAVILYVLEILNQYIPKLTKVTVYLSNGFSPPSAKFSIKSKCDPNYVIRYLTSIIL